MTLNANPPQPVYIEDEMRASYIDYAMSVIVSRALPDVRDGLKPVQRRILYAMHDMGIRSSSQHRKSARIVGEVLGKFHPHGDSSVYDALVRMAQPFVMSVPLVDGQGNFGSVDHDPAAAMRYTEARMTPASELLLADIAEETVPFRENFDSSNQEPTVLPTRLPNLLVNGANGIAVGMATNIPPHNLAEVCDAVVKLIDQPDATVDQLMRVLPGPDLPTAAVIRGTAGIREMYETGRGKIVMEAVTSVEQRRNRRQRIVVTELPYQTVKSSLVERIADLVKNKTITGITEIRDESDRHGIRIVIELARDAQPNLIINNLYQRTAMRTNFNAIMLALVDDQPKELPLRDIIQLFINHRAVVIENRARYRLRRSLDRQHIVEGLLTALDAIDEIIETIRSSRDTEAARSSLTQKFHLTDAQAQAILDMQLRRLSSLETERLQAEHQELTNTIAQLQELLQDDAIVLAEIRNQTLQVKKQLSQPRRTVIADQEVSQNTIEDLVPQEDVVISLSQRGYLKRIPISAYRSYRRGARGLQNSSRNDDPTKHIRVFSTHDQILFFSNQGRVHTLDVYKLPNDTPRSGQGTLLVNLIDLGPNERIQTLDRLDRSQPDQLHIFATRQGRVASILSHHIANLRYHKAALIKTRPGDEIVQVRTAQAADDVVLTTTTGQTIRFPVSEIPVHGRSSTGVTGIKNDDDPLADMDIIRNPDQYVVMATNRGYAKATPAANIPVKHRGRKGLQGFKTDAKTGHVVAVQAVDQNALQSEDYDMFILSEHGRVSRINLSEVRTVNTRQTRGVLVWRESAPDDQVTSITCFHSPQDQDAEAIANQPSAADDQQTTLFE